MTACRPARFAQSVDRLRVDNVLLGIPELLWLGRAAAQGIPEAQLGFARFVAASFDLARPSCLLTHDLPRFIEHRAKRASSCNAGRSDILHLN